ncbi:MAG: hypothetical protein PH343_04425 [Nitrospira sp.]|nr:hypothetical protein [Nitrospira sp.]
MKHTLFKTLSVSLVAFSTLTFCANQVMAQEMAPDAPAGEIAVAAPLASVQAVPSNNIVYIKGNYNVIFTTATAGAVKKVDIIFPVNFNLTNAKLIEADVIGAGSLTRVGQTFTYTVTAGAPPVIAAGTRLRIMIGDIVNNGNTGAQSVSVTTKDVLNVVIDGPTASTSPGLVKINAGMIADNAITTTKIAANAIDGTKIAPAAVGPSQISNGAIQSNHFSIGAVDSAAIAAGAIGNVDLAVGSYPNITGVGTLSSLAVSGDTTLATTLGNVGIGTTNLYQKLTVNGTIGFSDGTTPLLMNSQTCCTAGNRMLWAHSPSFSTWGIYYNDTNDKMYWQTSAGHEVMTVDFPSGRLGVGTASPSSRLHVYSPDNPTILRLQSSGSPGAGRIEFWSDPAGSVNEWRPGYIQSTDQGSFTGGLAFYTNGTGSLSKTGSMEAMRITNGNVGIGTTAPAEKLHVAGNFIRVDGAGGEDAYMGGDGFGGDVQIGSLNSAITNVAMYNPGSGLYMHLYVGALHIMGGADIAEPFKSTYAEEIRPGMIVAIDPANPGQLRIADKAYDKTVAGVVSGANGINPGVTMTQEGSQADGTIPVALTGRVYAWVDASYGGVEPGDLLTTSDTPGHAMKVNDYAKGQGTIIGKAMTALKEGKGLVLVLVSLQ